MLHHVSLRAEAGKTLALIGPSGGGKTTISQLIMRFYDVSDGSVTVDGTDVRGITQASLRRNIGIIQQDVYMFAGTVRENIRYGRPDATDEEIVEAARLAELHDEIMQMPDGYDSYIGERGVMLSGGQKQRISIARVFLKNPPVLILDEATSALDTVTERRIQASLRPAVRRPHEYQSSPTACQPFAMPTASPSSSTAASPSRAITKSSSPSAAPIFRWRIEAAADTYISGSPTGNCGGNHSVSRNMNAPKSFVVRPETTE